MKFVAAVMLSAMAVGMVDAQSKFAPLQNPGKNQCIQVDKYNDSNDQYRLKFGACKGNKRTLGFRHEGNGKALKTKDNYCLSTAKASKNDNTEIILTDCPSKLGSGQKWTKVGRNQWKNGYGKCLDYSGSKFVQKSCKTLSTSDKSSTQQYVLLKDAPAPQTPSILCANWLNKFSCPSNAVPIDNPSGLICLGATDYSCNQVCCQAPRTCGNYAIRCPADTVFNKARPCGNPGQPACNSNTCCDYAGPQKCGNSGVKCPYGYKLDFNMLCGTSKYGPCNRDTCCYTDKVTTCKTANYKCQYGSELLPSVICNTPGYPSCKESVCCKRPSVPNTCRSVNFRCNYGETRNDNAQCSNPGQPGCSRSICCNAPEAPNTCRSVNFRCNYGEKRNDNARCNNPGDPACNRDTCCIEPAPPAQKTCKTGMVTPCPTGWKLLGDKLCGAPGQGSCVAINCCEEPPKPTQTCASAKCSANQVLISNPDSETDLSKCCVDDTCKLWGERVLKNDDGLASVDQYCQNKGFQGFIPSADRDDKCRNDNGDTIKCTDKLCCVSAAPQPDPQPDPMPMPDNGSAPQPGF